MIGLGAFSALEVIRCDVIADHPAGAFRFRLTVWILDAVINLSGQPLLAANLAVWLCAIHDAPRGDRLKTGSRQGS